MWYVVTTVRIMCIIFSLLMIGFNVSDMRSDIRFCGSNKKEKVESVCIRILLISMYVFIILLLLVLDKSSQIQI